LAQLAAKSLNLQATLLWRGTAAAATYSRRDGFNWCGFSRASPSREQIAEAEPPPRGFCVAAARERCRELAREHALHGEDGGLRDARALAREAKLRAAESTVSSAARHAGKATLNGTGPSTIGAMSKLLQKRVL
jgi:hypothetical protein